MLAAKPDPAEIEIPTYLIPQNWRIVLIEAAINRAFPDRYPDKHSVAGLVVDLYESFWRMKVTPVEPTVECAEWKLSEAVSRMPAEREQLWRDMIVRSEQPLSDAELRNFVFLKHLLSNRDKKQITADRPARKRKSPPKAA